jgi:hypothetical protein
MEADPRIEKAFRWLLSLRQEDGGWAIAMRTHGMSYREATELTEPLLAVSSKPFSHLITGVVLRAFAAHPQHRQSRAARDAGRLLASRFFQADKYVDRRSKAYWERVSYPFWFTDIVSALDSLSQLGFHSEDPAIENALDRLRDLQLQDGLFQLKLLRAKDNATKFWVCLAICRIFQRFFSPQ